MSGRRDPFEDIEELFDRVSRGLDQMTHGFDEVDRGFAASPFGGGVPVDVFDDGEAVVVVADLPGYDVDDVDLTVDGRDLRLRAERDTETESHEEGRYHRRERRRERVSRQVTLPAAVAEEAARATYEDGVLRVTLPKRDADADGHRIDIE